MVFTGSVHMKGKGIMYGVHIRGRNNPGEYLRIRLNTGGKLKFGDLRWSLDKAFMKVGALLALP